MRLRLTLAVLVLAAAPAAAQSDTARVMRSLVPARYQAASDGDSQVGAKALVGAGIGAVVGLVVDGGRLYFADAPDPCPQLSCTDNNKARLSPPFGTSMLIGVGAGILVGSFVGWRMDANHRVAITAAPGTNSFALRARASF